MRHDAFLHSFILRRRIRRIRLRFEFIFNDVCNLVNLYQAGSGVLGSHTLHGLSSGHDKLLRSTSDAGDVSDNSNSADAVLSIKQEPGLIGADGDSRVQVKDRDRQKKDNHNLSESLSVHFFSLIKSITFLFC